MSKYYSLYKFLKNSSKVSEVLTFQELENILGFPLPHSAFSYVEWWGNEISPNTRHKHCKEWLSAGWKVENVNLGVNVTFSKIV